MDADDILEEKEKDKFLKLKQSLTPDTDMVMMKYHTAFDEAGKPSFSYYRERWIRLLFYFQSNPLLRAEILQIRRQPLCTPGDNTAPVHSNIAAAVPNAFPLPATFDISLNFGL